jgi:hypothetical protein
MHTEDPRTTLLARLTALERQAASQAELLADVAQQTEVRSLLSMLARIRSFLETATPGPGLDEAEHALDSATLLLASLGPAG